MRRLQTTAVMKLVPQLMWQPLRHPNLSFLRCLFLGTTLNMKQEENMFTSVIFYPRRYISGSSPVSQSERTLLRLSCLRSFPAMRQVMLVIRMEAQLRVGGLRAMFNQSLQACLRWSLQGSRVWQTLWGEICELGKPLLVNNFRRAFTSLHL